MQKEKKECPETWERDERLNNDRGVSGTPDSRMKDELWQVSEQEEDETRQTPVSRCRQMSGNLAKWRSSDKQEASKTD